MPWQSKRNVSETIGWGRLPRPRSAVFALALAAGALGAGGAGAAECPAFPPAAIKFTAMPPEIERDTSLSAKDLGKAISADKPMPGGYTRALSGAAAQRLSLAKLPDGTVCAAVHEIEFKIGIKRKIYVAQELANDSCVVDTVADIESPLVRSDDDALMRVGAALSQTFAAEVAALGTSIGPSQDEARKPLTEKVSALWRDKVFPAFEREMSAAAAKVDLTQWKKAPCGGATDKAFATLNAHSGTLDNPNWQAMLQQFQQQQQARASMASSMSNNMGGMGGGMMGH
jgi:hypothetical protein